MMMRQNKKAVAAIMFLIGFLLFIVLGVNYQKATFAYTQNCTDVVSAYQPCELHKVKYGFPLTYATGNPIIPGRGYARDEIKPQYLIANAFIWLIPLPLIAFILTRNKIAS